MPDRAAMHSMKSLVGDYKLYDFLSRGSDERRVLLQALICQLVQFRTRYVEITPSTTHR